MKVWNASEEQIRQAASLASVKIHSYWAGSGIVKDGRALRFRLALDRDKRTDSGGMYWQRTSASAFRSDRKVAAVCWHGHFAFMSALLSLADDARIQTAFADYRGRDDFYAKAPETAYRNVGSQMYPRQMNEICTCEAEGLYMESAYDLGKVAAPKVSCPECGADVWDVAQGSKLNKCWNSEAHASGGTLAFDTDEEDEDDETYKIVRMYADPNHAWHRTVIDTGLSLAEAQAHCRRDDTRESGVWFDGYEAE